MIILFFIIIIISSKKDFSNNDKFRKINSKFINLTKNYLKLCDSN